MLPLPQVERSPKEAHRKSAARSRHIAILLNVKTVGRVHLSGSGPREPLPLGWSVALRTRRHQPSYDPRLSALFLARNEYRGQTRHYAAIDSGGGSGRSVKTFKTWFPTEEIPLGSPFNYLVRLRSAGNSGQLSFCPAKMFHLFRPVPPVIFITAFGDEELHEQAHHAGALAVINKPLDIDELRAFITSYLANKGA